MRLATALYRGAMCVLLVLIGFFLDDISRQIGYTEQMTSFREILRTEDNVDINTYSDTDSYQNEGYSNQESDEFNLAAYEYGLLHEDTETNAIGEYEDDENKAMLEKRLSKRQKLLEETAAMLAQWSASVAHCDDPHTSNILCATPRTVNQYEPLEYLPDLKNPCVCITPRGHSGGLHVLKTEDEIGRGCRLRCVPYVYLMGFAKCGSTDLHYYISEHQLVQSGARKEVDWWCGGKVTEKRYWHDHNISNPLNVFAYMNMFRSASNVISGAKDKNDRHKRATDETSGDSLAEQSIILESSITNALRDTFYKGIHRLNPGAKLIYIMRDPVERIFSSFRFDYQKQLHGNEQRQSPEGFHGYVVDGLRKINRSHEYPYRLFYSCQYIKRISGPMRLFGRQNVKPVLFEEYIKDPLGITRSEILPYLGLPDYSANIRKRLKQASGAKNTSLKKYSMLPETRKLLQDFFRPHNRKLARALGDNKWTWGY